MSATLMFIGAGKMGGALLSGLDRTGDLHNYDVVVVEPSFDRRSELAAHFPSVTLCETVEPNVCSPDGGAVLCVKPDLAESVCRLLEATGVPRVLSIAAGVSTQRMGLAAPSVRCVRAMTNTAAVVGRAASVISGGESATSSDLDWAESVLRPVGTVVRMPERLLDSVTGLSGSGPAYVFLMAEAMIDAGVLSGLSRDDATALVAQTISGAGEMLLSGTSPEVLRAEVTSPAGTTAAGLRILELKAVRSAFIEAVATAVERSRQLGH